MLFNKKASVFVYVLLLINIALILWYVVLNNTHILNNNIDIWRNSEEVYAQIFNKWNISIQSVKEFNSNWNWFQDLVSCPTNITMSGTTYSGSFIPSEVRYDYGTVYCEFSFRWDTWKIFFDSTMTYFTKVFFWWENLDIVQSFSWEALIPQSNYSITSWSWVYLSNDQDNINDNNESTDYVSDRDDYTWFKIDITGARYLSKIAISKPRWTGNSYRNNWVIDFFDTSNNFLDSVTVSWIKNDQYIEIPLSFSFIDSSRAIDKIHFYSSDLYKRFNISELYLYEYTDVSNPIWRSKTPFNYYWTTEFFFNNQGVWWDDNFDDDMNSDNYRSTSSWSIWYPSDYYDDDIVPRLNIYGSVEPDTDYFYNVFWNNYKTNDFIDNNLYNSDTNLYLVKASEVEEWYMFFDLFSKTDDNLNYDIKIIEYDRNKYKDEYTLEAKTSYETYWLTDNFWYLQFDSWSWTLSLSSFKTGNEFVFDFKNKDYAVFLKNNKDSILAYKLSWEEKRWDGDLDQLWRLIYINPIDESDWNQIKAMANHILIWWWEKNFIWDNFIVVSDK